MQDSTPPPDLASAQQLLARHQVGPHELQLVREFGKGVIDRLDVFIDRFYDWMIEQPEFALFFSDDQRLHRVKRLQSNHWKTFFEAEIDERYVRMRHDVGAVHARIGLGLPAYFSAMDMSLTLLVDEMYQGDLKGADLMAAQRAVTKLVHIDTAIVVEAYSRIVNEKIADQARSILEMSTPVTALWEDILMLPVVGIVDSRRAQEIMRSVLTRIAETRARVFIMDISGVSVIDTAVANHLIKVTKATRLMGCECMLSGLSPAIAQTIVELGIDVGAVHTRATLRDALEEGFQRIGIEIRRAGD
jgi:rsbT co-antagonist protein RsbR